MTNTTQIIIHAARTGNMDVLQEMIRQRTNVNIQDEKGHTPLIAACSHNHYEAAKLLLESGADINSRDYVGNTALMFASMLGRVALVELLLTFKNSK